MKKFLCVAAIAAFLATCSACGSGSALQTGEGAEITKGYFAGLDSANSVTVDLKDYVDANGTAVTYAVRSDHPDIVTATVDGNTLTATMRGADGLACVTVGVSSNGKKAFDLYFKFTANIYERVACIGDSLTYGHSWHNESYPVYLQELLGDGIEVQNFGVNGSAVTNRSESNYKLKYDTLKEYSDSIAFAPDIVVVMLGTNDGYNWTGSAPAFEAEYGKLIDAYFESGAKQVVMLTSPPTLSGNAFNLPNDVIRTEVCPRQRAIAEDYALPLVDVREAFEAHEDLQSLYRPGDGVHFSVDGARFVARLVCDALIKL